VLHMSNMWAGIGLLKIKITFSVLLAICRLHSIEVIDESCQIKVDIVYKWINWYFVYIVGFNVHILQIQTYYSNTSHATDF
jgi:hypothetical protein